MASQLATLFLRRLEVPIVLRDVREEAIASALDIDPRRARRAGAKGRYDEGKARFLGELVTGSTDYEGFADCDLVLEAVFEEIPIKQQVFGEVEARRASGLRARDEHVGALGHRDGRRARPSRSGSSACTSSTRSPSCRSSSSSSTPAHGRRDARHRGRPSRAAAASAACSTHDAPGFVVNRLLTRMTSTLMEALERGNTVEETDEAVLRLGLPMAPSVLLQMVGPRVAWHVLETMHAAYPDRFPLSPTLRAIADGSEPPGPGPEVSRRPSTRSPTPCSTRSRTRSARMLDEDVVGAVADVDTCLLLGAGFPFFLGGITPRLDDERRLGAGAAAAGSPRRRCAVLA